MNRLQIGRLKHRITIQTNTDIPVYAAEIEEDRRTVYRTWASIEPFKGTVYFDTKQIDQAVSHKIIIRFDKRFFITAQHWIYYRGVRYRVRYVRNLFEGKRFLELLCEQTELAIDPFEVGENAVGDPLQELAAE